MSAKSGIFVYLQVVTMIDLVTGTCYTVSAGRLSILINRTSLVDMLPTNKQGNSRKGKRFSSQV